MAWNNTKSLMEVPFAEWELVQWLLLLITVALAVLGVLRGKTILQRELRQRREKKEAEAEGRPWPPKEDGEDEDVQAPADDPDAPVVVTTKDLEGLDDIDLDDEEDDT